MVAFKTEQAMAAHVVEWFRSLGYDVLEEVQVEGSGPVADIVARMGRKIHVVECKRQFCSSLLEQALHWSGQAHRISIAFPTPAEPVSAARMNMVRQLGIGILLVAEDGRVHDALCAPPRRPLQTAPLESALTTDLEEWDAKAGSTDGDHLTPFQLTARRVWGYVAGTSGTGGVEISDLVLNVKHHYSSDRSADVQLTKAIKSGWIKGVKAKGQGRQLRVYAEVD